MNKNGRSILIIDSEQSWMKFCETTLKRNGYEVYITSDGQVAKKLLAGFDEDKIVLVLIDIKCIEEDASIIPVLLQQKSGPAISVVVVFPIELTPNRARLAFKLGASDCVSKPYDEDSLLALVEQMLASHRISPPRQRYVLRDSIKVLVIDDDEDWLETLVRYLPEQIGLANVEKAAEFETALQKIKQYLFDLVICDLRLVDADDSNFQGMDLIKEIRKKEEEREGFSQIIIVSAYGTPEHIRESYKALKIYYYFDKRYFAPLKYRDSVIQALNIQGDFMGRE